MLKCCIIYVPGTGGIFLRRILSLSSNTICYNSKDNVSLQEKIKNFYWDSKDWKKAENNWKPSYRSGKEDFYLFENSHLNLIDAWQPTEFYNHEKHSLAWVPGSWEHIIFIKATNKHKDFLLANQGTKHYWLDWKNETEKMDLLCNNYPHAMQIEFDDLLEKQKFAKTLSIIKQNLNFDFDKQRCMEYWQQWIDTSSLVWTK